MPTGQLTAKQIKFCEQWMLLGDKTKAAAAAGYSRKTAAQIGYQLMQRPEIRAHIAELQQKTAELAGITRVMVARELKRVAFSDLSDFVEWGPQGVTLKAIDQVDTRAVAEVSETKSKGEKTLKIKLYDKKAALDSLNKMLGFNEPERSKVEAEVSGLGDLLGLAFANPDGPPAD